VASIFAYVFPLYFAKDKKEYGQEIFKKILPKHLGGSVDDHISKYVGGKGNDREGDIEEG
jgi:hypothetical protein